MTITATSSPFEAEQSRERRYRTGRRVVWSIALLFISVFAVDTFFTLQLHVTSAPQQAAEAAEGLFYTAVPYMIARGIHAMLR